MRDFGLAAIGGFFAVIALAGASAQEGENLDPAENARQYQACLELLKQDPQQALDGAIAWEKRGGADAARHCEALALIALGENEDGALALERLAADQPRAALKRAVDLLAQAAQAWIAAGKPDRALADQNQGLGLMPDHIDLLVDRAINYGEAGQYQEALADLTRAHELAPQDAEILAYRAAALTPLERFGEAEADLTAALAIDPKEAKAWLELGRLKKATGDRQKAREALLQAALLAPGTPIAEAAQAQLAAMDVQTEP